MPTKKKIDLKKEAAVTNDVEVEVKITDAMLRELCPDELLGDFKLAKSPAARADFLYDVYHNDLKDARDRFNDMEDFVNKLKAWFVQEFEGDQKGVTGKIGRVEVKKKEVPLVSDWTKVYAYIKRTGSFELLNKAINKKAVQDRWEQKKEIPGLDHFNKPSVSLTGVKGK